MPIIKKILRGLSSFAFKFLILTLAIVISLVLTFNSPKKIEKSLNDSGVYSTFISSALQEVQKSNDKNKKMPLLLLFIGVLCSTFVIGKTLLIKDQVAKDTKFEEQKIETKKEAKKEHEELEDLK